MRVVFKSNFYSVKFDSSICQVYYTKEKVKCFFGDALEYAMIFML
jgi:hypothetical protein